MQSFMSDAICQNDTFGEMDIGVHAKIEIFFFYTYDVLFDQLLFFHNISQSLLCSSLGGIYSLFLFISFSFFFLFWVLICLSR